MYQNNPLLRSAGEKIVYTEAMKKEWLKCSQDIFYWAEKYFTVIEIDSGKHVIKLRDYQKKMLAAMVEPPTVPHHSHPDKKHAIVLSSRQVGKCLTDHTKIKIKNKETGEIKEMNIGCLYKNSKKLLAGD